MTAASPSPSSLHSLCYVHWWNTGLVLCQQQEDIWVMSSSHPAQIWSRPPASIKEEELVWSRMRERTILTHLCGRWWSWGGHHQSPSKLYGLRSFSNKNPWSLLMLRLFSNKQGKLLGQAVRRSSGGKSGCKQESRRNMSEPTAPPSLQLSQGPHPRHSHTLVSCPDLLQPPN